MTRARLLLANVFVVASCALVYELLAATLASYVLGDTVRQFSIVLGLYLSAMGVGAAVTRRIAPASAARRFLEAELALAVVGGASVPLLLVAMTFAGAFRPLLYLEVAAIGALVGVELPLLMRMLAEDLETRTLVAHAMAWDHLGALAASVAFPLLLVPHLGLVRTAALCGAANAAIVLGGTSLLRTALGDRGRGLRVGSVAVLILLAGSFALAARLVEMTGG